MLQLVCLVYMFVIHSSGRLELLVIKAEKRNLVTRI